MLKNINIKKGVFLRNLKGSSKASSAAVCGTPQSPAKGRLAKLALYILDNIVLIDTLSIKKI